MKRIVVFLAMALMAFSVAQAESEQDSTFVFGPADTETAAPELTPSPTPASTPIPADSGDSGFDFSQVDNPLATPVAVNPIDMPTPTPTPAPNYAYETYKNDSMGISFDIPYTWLLNPATNQETTIQFVEPKSERMEVDGYQTRLTVEKFSAGLSQTASDARTRLESVITELGGTIGDIESQPFVEAIRQYRKEAGPENVCYIHVSLVPYIAAAHEVKTKPTQHSVKELRSFGIQPDIIVLRSDHHIDDAIRGKIASFCDVDTDCVFTNEDCASIYDVPQLLAEQDFDLRICERLGLDPHERDMSEWNEFLRKQNHANHHADKVKIAVVGKYTQLPDAYLSVIEALHHAGVFYDRHVDVQLVDGESLDEQNVSEVLGDASGILVPGGFGKRALEGKILAAEFAREHKIPYLGICLGMQVAVCEFARNVVGLAGASSSEFDPDGPFSVIDLMSSQEDVTEKGGTMRLGAYPCKLAADTLAREAYGEDLVYERHRHRFEFNNAFRDQLEDAGLVISGLSPDERLVEMVELPRDVHPWYVATQAHPEFKSRPTNPQPLFREFVRASIGQHEGVDRLQVTPMNLATD